MTHHSRCRKTSATRRLLLALAADILIAGCIIGGDYLYSYRLPHRFSPANIVTAVQNTGDKHALEDAAGSSTQEDWKVKFQEHFSDTVISTDTVYKSPNISIELSRGSYDSGVVDHSDSGKHLRYGSSVYYTLADVYVSDITSLQTAFAEDTYGVGYTETLNAMSARMGSVLSVNGDSYSNNRHKDNGTIIRNGVVFRTQRSTEETCVLYRDGTMKTYPPDRFSPKTAIENGAWQTWVFGPSLLDENGNAKSDFLTWDYISQSHPRTAIGYYEPGHYCLLVVDGRQPKLSRGMFLEEMSQLFASLGCKAAYNLDGGHCAFMDRGTSPVSKPYKPTKAISDGIFICEPGGIS